MVGGLVTEPTDRSPEPSEYVTVGTPANSMRPFRSMVVHVDGLLLGHNGGAGHNHDALTCFTVGSRGVN